MNIGDDGYNVYAQEFKVLLKTDDKIGEIFKVCLAPFLVGF
jgi:hypothetical protein